MQLDMVIENNCSAMRWLEGLRAQMAALPDEAARQRSRLPVCTAGPPGALIDVLHVRAIQRVYGEHAGEIVDLLKINPCVTVRQPPSGMANWLLVLLILSCGSIHAGAGGLAAPGPEEPRMAQGATGHEATLARHM